MKKYSATFIINTKTKNKDLRIFLYEYVENFLDSIENWSEISDEVSLIVRDYYSGYNNTTLAVTNFFTKTIFDLIFYKSLIEGNRYIFNIVLVNKSCIFDTFFSKVDLPENDMIRVMRDRIY